MLVHPSPCTNNDHAQNIGDDYSIYKVTHNENVT